MAFNKFTADNIFTGTALLGKGNVLITNENGMVVDIIPVSEAGDDIQHQHGILSPGFVNCHCHLELSHMKGIIPQKTGLVDFVITVMQQRNFALEAVLQAIEKAETEMLQNGIVAVGDICNTAHTLGQKQKGNLYYYNFIEATGFVPQYAEKRFEQAEEAFKQFRIADFGLQIVDRESSNLNRQPSHQFTIHHSPFTSIVPHAPYSTSPRLMDLINEHSAGKVVSIHNQETMQENSFFQTGESDFRKLFALFNINIDFYKPSGKTSLQTYLPHLNKPANLILVHNTFIAEEDVLFINRQSAIANPQSPIFCLCPNANLYIENSLAPIDLLRKHGVAIVVGTDSLASNHTLSILEEIKTLQRHFAHIPARELLQWATLNGAKALQMNSLLGSFEKGKKPGVICLGGDLGDNLDLDFKRIEGVRRLI